MPCAYLKCNFPLPHVFPPPPFPLKREPTASAPRGDTLSTRIDCYRSLLMPLVRGRKESKLVRSLVLFIKLGVRLARRLAARVPSLKLHIPCIRTLRIGLNPPQLHEVQYRARSACISLSAGQYHCALSTISFRCRCGSCYSHENNSAQKINK